MKGHLGVGSMILIFRLEVRTLKIDIKDLLGSVQTIRTSRTRISYPDDPTPVEIADPPGLSAALDEALCAFRDLRGGTDYLVNAEVNTFHRSVWVRFVQGGPVSTTAKLSPRSCHRFKSFVPNSASAEAR